MTDASYIYRSCITARQILEALEGAKATLKEVGLGFAENFLPDGQGGPLKPADFDGFPALKRVRVARHDNLGDGGSPILSIGDKTTELGLGRGECPEICSKPLPHWHTDGLTFSAISD